MGRTKEWTAPRRGALVGLVAIVVTAFAVTGVARSSPAQAGVARITAVVCVDLDLSIGISADASALVALTEPLANDHIGALVRFQTAAGVTGDWQALPDSAARQFQPANAHHFDDTLVVAPISAAVAVQVRLEALGTWSDGSTGGGVELPWTPAPDCAPVAPAPTPAPGVPLGGLDATVDLDADVDLDVDGLVDLDADVDADVEIDLDDQIGVDADADVDMDATVGLDDPLAVLPSLPVPLPTGPAPTAPLVDLDVDADLDLDIDLGLVPVIVGPIVGPVLPTTPGDDPSLVGIAARVHCGVGIAADLDLVLVGRAGAASHVVVVHPDTLLDVDLQVAAGSTTVVPLLDVVLGHRVLTVLVDGLVVDVALDLSCPIDLAALLTPTCLVVDGGVRVHLASRLDASLALLLGVKVLDPITGIDALATLNAGASADVELDLSGAGSLLELRAQLLGIDLAIGTVRCSPAPNGPTSTTPSTPTTLAPGTVTPTAANPTPGTPNEPSPPTVPPTPTGPEDPRDPTGPTTTTPGPAGPASPPGPAGPSSGATPGAVALTSPANATAGTPSTGSLPTTGTNSLLLVAAASALLACGLGAVHLARRRRPVIER